MFIHCLFFVTVIIVNTLSRVIPSDYVATPLKRFYHKSCVHRFESGVRIGNDGTIQHTNGSITDLGPCPYPILDRQGNILSVTADVPRHSNNFTDDGWVMDAYVMVKGSGVASFTDVWTVPPAPVKPAANFYFFSGLMPSHGKWILQPVLQWAPGEVDPSVCHTSNSWEFLSYWVSAPPYRVICSDPINVNAGDLLFGNMTRLRNGDWAVHSKDITTASVTSSIVVPKSTVPSAEINLGLTLEMYGCSAGCDCYPNGKSGSSVTFSKNQGFDMSGTSIQMEWEHYNHGSCGNKFSFGSNGDVTMSWGQ